MRPLSGAGRGVVIVLSLPFVAAAALALVHWGRIALMPAPQWIVSASGQVFDSCEGIAAVEAYQATPAGPTERPAISGTRASQIIDRVLFKTYGFAIPAFPDMHHLVHATFPDGQQGLAWYRVTMFETFARACEENNRCDAAAVYVDAQTGAPLVLIQDAIMEGEPAFRGVCDDQDGPTTYWRVQMIALMGLVIYPVLALPVMGVIVRVFRKSPRR